MSRHTFCQQCYSQSDRAQRGLVTVEQQEHRPPHSETPPDGTNLNQECKLAADSGAFRPYTSMHRSHSFGSLLPAQAYTLTALVYVSGRLCRPFLTALVYVTQTGLVYVALRESRALAET